MATKKKKPSGASSGAPSGDSSGARSGPSSGETATPTRVPALDLDDLEGELRANRAQLQDVVRVFGADGDGRAVGGARLMPLLRIDPIETLGDRVADEWGGPRVYWIQIRALDGQVIRWARCRVGSSRLGRQNVMPVPAAAAAEPQSSSPNILGVIRELKDLGVLGQPTPAAAAAAHPAPMTLAEQIKDMTKGVDALEAAGIATRKRDGGDDRVITIVRELKEPLVTAFGQFVGAMQLLVEGRKLALEEARAQRLEQRAQRLVDEAHRSEE